MSVNLSERFDELLSNNEFSTIEKELEKAKSGEGGQIQKEKYVTLNGYSGEVNLEKLSNKVRDQALALVGQVTGQKDMSESQAKQLRAAKSLASKINDYHVSGQTRENMNKISNIVHDSEVFNKDIVPDEELEASMSAHGLTAHPKLEGEQGVAKKEAVLSRGESLRDLSKKMLDTIKTKLNSPNQAEKEEGRSLLKILKEWVGKVSKLVGKEERVETSHAEIEKTSVATEETPAANKPEESLVDFYKRKLGEKLSDFEKESGNPKIKKHQKETLKTTLLRDIDNLRNIIQTLEEEG